MAVSDDRPDVRRWHTLPPSAHRRAFTILGLFVQLVAVAMPATYVAVRTEQTQATITKATLLLVGRDVVHTRDGVILLVVASALFAIGSILLARPYVRSWLTLLVAVPIAAVAGVLILGVGALVIAFLVWIVLSQLDLSDLRSGRRRRTRAGRQP